MSTRVSPKKFAKKMFWIGSKTHDADDRIIFKKTTGTLYCDPDGNGSAKAAEIVKINKSAHITYTELFVV